MKGEHFLPFRRSDVVAMCAEELRGLDREQFVAFARMLASLVHQRMHERIERLKDAYHPFHPEADTRAVRPLDRAERAAARTQVEEELTALARAANFVPMSISEVEEAMAGHSLLKLRLEIDTRDVDSLLLFRRGESVETVTEKRFWFWRREVSFVKYARVLVYAKFKDANGMTTEQAIKLPYRPGSIIVKLFQNVPRQDLEMIFPNVRIGMRLVDKLFIGVPAVISGIIVVVTKVWFVLGSLLVLFAFWLGPRRFDDIDSAKLLAMGLALFAVGSYAFRQVSNFKNRKLLFMKALSENLYYRNLDNDAGVFHHLLDAAEEAEGIEALLAYHFLRSAMVPLTQRELDERVEQWFQQRWEHDFDFEVEDGLRKLAELGLVTNSMDGRYTAVPLDQALNRLDRLWDEVFTYAEPATVQIPSPSPAPA
jgi:Protein of unknown function (DUF3754)